MEKENVYEAYESLAGEVRVFRDLVLAKLPTNEKAKSLYKGCDILYSSLSENPTFLFIGINPGGGYFKSKGEITKDWELEEGDGFEYLNAMEQGYDYTIAKQTRKLFELAGYYEYLKDAVKTNFFYFHTTKEKELFDLFYSLGDDINGQFHANAWKWTRKMIDIIKPKIIICEGIGTFKRLASLYKVTPIREGCCGSFKIEDRILVIGYSRLFSNIIEIPETAEFIKRKISERKII